MNKKLGILALAVVVGPQAMAQFTETEPNNNKATANVFAPAGAGFTITGNSTGTSTITAGAASADTFRINMFTGPLGIYRHQLTVSSATAGHGATLRGLNQTSSTNGGVVGTVDTTVQTGTGATDLIQWYGFGKGESLYYRVTGTSSTTADYTATHSMTQVNPLDAGVYSPGQLTISTIGTTGTSQTDTDFWVYDANFNAIAGYGQDDETPPGTSFGGTLIRNYAPGVYYLAVSNFNLANNQTAAADDRFMTGAIMDFPDIVANSSTTANLNVSFTINGQLTQATKVAAFDVVFAKFTVVPEPGTMIAVGAGIGALALRRRRRVK